MFGVSIEASAGRVTKKNQQNNHLEKIPLVMFDVDLQTPFSPQFNIMEKKEARAIVYLHITDAESWAMGSGYPCVTASAMIVFGLEISREIRLK